MSELPNDFFSWKSFQNLTQTSAIAWALILVIDAIFIVGIQDEYMQLKLLWGIGFAVCLILAAARLYFKEEKEKGDKLFLIFNAALIFLYASGFNGFTKELGSWSELNKTFAQKDSLTQQRQGANMLNIELASWVPAVFSKQTSFFPDVKIIAENNALKIENKILTDRIAEIKPVDNSAYTKTINELMSENGKLQKQLAENKPPDSSGYIATIAGLQKEKLALQNRLAALTKLINESNDRIQKLRKIREDNCVKRNENIVFKSYIIECPNGKEYLQSLESIVPIEIE